MSTLSLRYSSPMEIPGISIPQPAIDGPWRADSFGAKLVPARNSGGFEALRLIEHRSFAVYGDLAAASTRELIRHSLSWIFRQPESVVPLILNRFDALSGPLEFLGKPVGNAELEPGQLKDFIRELIGYGESYGDLLKRAGMVWSPNGRYLVSVIPLGPEELTDRELQLLLVRLIELSEHTTLRPFLVTEDPTALAPELQDGLDWQAFIGSAPVSYFRDRYAMAIAPGMVSRVPIGVSLDRPAEAARTLNGLSYEPTEATVARKRAIASDAASYERFLEGLRDGN